MALQVGPEPVPIYKAIAKVYLAQKKEEKAMESLDTALQLQLSYGSDDDMQIAEISRELGNNFTLPFPCSHTQIVKRETRLSEGRQ